jgi:hypothetical protein
MSSELRVALASMVALLAAVLLLLAHLLRLGNWWSNHSLSEGGEVLATLAFLGGAGESDLCSAGTAVAIESAKSAGVLPAQSQFALSGFGGSGYYIMSE